MTKTCNRCTDIADSAESLLKQYRVFGADWTRMTGSIHFSLVNRDYDLVSQRSVALNFEIMLQELLRLERSTRSFFSEPFCRDHGSSPTTPTPRAPFSVEPSKI